ncbi:hypothetical protein COB21_03795 [Candidatus Aerophobetes bacterium]|uniref:Adenylate/guanylate cyclase domain-containing protein n=1 Tax=Aerophobetes bacterium TaxID=2030807 RepID=A0A2A4X494_UNCAE|nr:MAG: hypothetical protein COB21_03795 [Candidatus Aerophobetes bacterium]
MKFRIKLFYSFISITVLSSLLALFIIYGEASNLIFHDLRQKIYAILVHSQSLMEKEALLVLETDEGDASSDTYQALRKELLRIKNINQEADIFIKNVYLIRHQAAEFVVVTSAEENKDYMTGNAIKLHINKKDISKNFAVSNIYSDDEGTWITGYHSIFDHNGQEVGVLCIDFSVAELFGELEELILYGWIAFVVSVVVAIVVAFFLARFVSKSLKILHEAVIKIGQGELSTRCVLNATDEFGDLSQAINKMAKGLEERERLKVGFARYVSQYALEELLNLEKPVTLTGERKRVTILFSDIRHFTTISEKLEPEAVLAFLNEYFEAMIDIIFSYKGTLDKIMGDGLMVEFGAPLDDVDQEVHALLAAIAMQRKVHELSDMWEKQGRPRLEVGVGIHVGLVVVGNIGSERRMEYTAIGDPVNIASRLETKSKSLKKPIILSHAVYEKAKDFFVFEDLKETDIKGRVGSLHAWALFPDKQGDLEEIRKKIESSAASNSHESIQK